jgi:hypothetical protein
MGPGVAGRAELVIGRAVGITQVKRVEDLDRPMIVAGGRGGGERARLAIQFRRGAARLVTPLARRRRTEADPEGIRRHPRIPER